MDRCKSSLSTPRQKLLLTMQRNPFSNIELTLQQGEPSFCPPPKITREIKLGTDLPLTPRADENDFTLKRSVADLFNHFDRLADGTQITIEVRHGLPVRLILAGEI